MNSRERWARCEWRGWEPRTAADIPRDRRAGGLVASGLAAIPPNSHADLTRARAEGRVATSLPREKHTRTKQKTFEKRKTKRGEWAPLTVGSGLLSRCTHEDQRGTRRRGGKLKITVFNGDIKAWQGMARQGKTWTETPGSNE